jgi:cytochrome P450
MAESTAPDPLAGRPGLQLTGPGLWETLTFLRSVSANYLALIEALQKHYGDLFRLRFGGQDLYVLLNPLDIERVLKADVERFPKNAFVTNEMRSLGPESVAVVGGERWRQHRRVMAPPFRPQALGGYGDVLRGALLALGSRWEEAAGGVRRVDEDAAGFAFNVLTRLMMGREAPEREARIRGALETEIACLSKRLASPIKLPHWAPTPNQIRLRRAQREFDRAVLEVVDQADDPLASGFAADWLRAYQRIEPDPEQARRVVRDQLATVITGGHQTVAFGLAYCLHLIAGHPEVGERLAAESRRVLAGRSPSAADLERLPTSARVVRESLRLYPVLPVVVRKAADAFELRGHPIPAGANVAISIWSAHRHPGFWVEPERFDPDRFTPERAARRHPGAYVPFSLGPRGCLAGDFALFELQAAVAYLCQFFRLEREPASVFEVAPKLALAPVNGVSLRIERHPKAPA